MLHQENRKPNRFFHETYKEDDSGNWNELNEQRLLNNKIEATGNKRDLFYPGCLRRVIFFVMTRN